MKRIAIFCLFAAMTLITGMALLHGHQSKPKYQDFTASPEERVADLIARMTLEEKTGQMQNTAPAIPRLGIPAYDWWNEALHGIARAGLATVFPQAIGLAATWDTDLQYRMADAISTEARAKYNDAVKKNHHGRYYGLTFWSPNINIFRDPRWGRGQETYGEDPYLTARMAVAFIKAMQGSDPRYFKTIATSKHFAVHSGPETSRHQFDAKATDFDLEHTYLPAFRATVIEGGAASVMCAYNRLNGAPACASTFLLQDELRNAWRFQGYVVSDCGAIADVYEGHHYAGSMAEASAKAVKAGTDLSCGHEYRTLAEAVKKGYIEERQIDESLKRLFIARFRLGMFDPPDRVPFSKINLDEVNSPSHRRIALEAAEKSLVLLKNENQILPLRKLPKRIAVLGPAADDPDALLGNYNGIPSHIVTPLEGIERKFSKRAEIRFALGSTYAGSSLALVPQSVLRPSNNEKSQHGLLAEYFGNDNLSGKPQVSRVEEREYFYWEMADPTLVKAIPQQNFSVRWSGFIEAPQSGDYQLGVLRAECHTCGRTDTAQVYLDDQLLIDDRQSPGEAMDPKVANVHLEVGKARRIRIEYKVTGNGGGVQLLWRPPAEKTLADAVDTARQSDLAILCLGLNSRLEGEESKIKVPGFSGGDRTSLNLPEPQESLLEAVLGTGKPTIVVLMNGSALAVKSAKARANALLEAWYPGQEGGVALGEALAGDYNPAGRLPVTFYESADQLPPFTDYSMRGRTYRYFTGQPLYPFGYGLSYSDFTYSDLSAKYNPQSSQFEITGTLMNRSSYDGDEVTQVYVSRKDGADPELKKFARVHLARGEKRQLHFVIDASGNPNQDFISLGGGQPLKEWTAGHYIQVKLPSRIQSMMPH